jgi:retron-type reverse transcriptase
MKRLGNLYGEITSFVNLRKAALEAGKGKRKKKQVLEFFYNLEYELVALQTELQQKTYTPRPYRTFVILDPKERTIAAAHFRDRVVHHAICQVIEPWLERSYIADSYACRKGKGSHRAILRAHHFIEILPYFMKLDVRKFFLSIDHQVLRGLLTRKCKDPDLLWLLGVLITTAPQSNQGKGIPIGNLTSQHFANLYLNDLDHLVKDKLRIPGYVRYMDDCALFAQSKEELHLAKIEIVQLLQSMRLELKESATLLCPSRQGLSFLGFRIFPDRIKIKRENWRRFKQKFQHRQQQFVQDELSPQAFTNSVASMIGHLRNGNTWRLLKKFLDTYSLDL